MTKKLRKKIKPLHIKYFKRMEICEFLYDNEEEKIWRVWSVLCVRTHLTDRVKLGGKHLNYLYNGKYVKVPTRKLPKEEVERRQKATEHFNKYNHSIDLNNIIFHLSTNNNNMWDSSGKINSCFPLLKKYSICENL